MTRILQDYRLSEYMEVFILLILGMVFQIVDGSPFSLKTRWKSVWDMEIPKEFFSVFAQNFIKTVLSLIVVARCSTTYLYVLSSLLVMACILTNGAPKLLLPWLLVAGLKSICLTLLETLIGVYVCSSFGKIEVACIEFIIQKAVEMLFASFLWLSILNMYNTMIAVVQRQPSEDFEPLSQETVKKADLKKRRARSLVDESTLSKTANLNYFEFKDVPKILMDMLKKEEDLSQDSLIAQGMMLASVSNMGSFDTLKTSQSLGELGSIDLKSFEVVGLDDDRDSPVEKALKFMKLTWDDIKKAKRKRKRSVGELYTVDDSAWEEIKKNKITINRPKITRPEEVFIRDFRRDDEPCKSGKFRRRTRAKSFDSRLNPDDETDYGEDEDENIQVDNTEAEEHLSKYMIMSNLKEEGQVFRIRLESAVEVRRAHKYADLYRQPHMSIIGPEVFDNACKLKKLISLSTDEEKEERVQRVIERDDEEEEKKPVKKKKKTIYFSDEVNLVPAPSSSKSIYEKSQSILISSNDKGTDMVLASSNTKTEESQSVTLSSSGDEAANLENGSTCSDSIHCNGSKSFNEAKSTFVEKLEIFENKLQAPEAEQPKEDQKQAHKISSDESNPNVNEKRIKVLIKRYSNTIENSENINGEKRIAIKLQNIHNRDSKDELSCKNKQVYFITELLHEPVSTCLKTLYEINSKSQKTKLSKKLYKIEKNPKTESIKNRWKSTVLKNLAEAGDVEILLQSTEKVTQQYPPLCLRSIKKLEKFNKKHMLLKQEKSSTKLNLLDGAASLNKSCLPPKINDSYKSPEETSSEWSLKSNESFSLYYSKAANLASPLFDVRRFIYPDRIHYSYQNMKNKEGFDVEISGELPIIVRESLTFNPYKAEKPPPLPESNTKITRRPMDLSFAFCDQNDENYNTPEAILSEQNLDSDSEDLISISSSDDIKSPENEKTERLYNKLVKLNSKSTYSLIQKILKTYLHKHKKCVFLECDFKD